MPKGDIVLAVTSGGRPIVRRVWEEREGEVLTCYEDYYQRWVKGGPEPMPISLPKEKVFKYDEHLLHQLDKAYQAKSPDLEHLWKRAKPHAQG